MTSGASCFRNLRVRTRSPDKARRPGRVRAPGFQSQPDRLLGSRLYRRSPTPLPKRFQTHKSQKPL
jgi:hypothetical protein